MCKKLPKNFHEKLPKKIPKKLHKKLPKKLHNEIAKYLNKSNINKIYVYGNQIKHTFNKLKPQIRGRVVKNIMDIYKLIKNDLPNNSYLMVKGSNSTGLNKIIKNL